jgi:predicted PurR-regulated permease PerM
LSENSQLSRTGLIKGLYILKPFIDILLWAVIFAIALYPLYDWINKRLKNRKKLSAVIIIILMLVVLTIPGLLLISAEKGRKPGFPMQE